MSTKGLANAPVLRVRGHRERDLEQHEEPHRGGRPGLELADGLEGREEDERGRRDGEVLLGLAQDSEEDSGEDGHPPGRDREPNEARLDSGRGLVARGQYGR